MNKRAMSSCVLCSILGFLAPSAKADLSGLEVSAGGAFAASSDDSPVQAKDNALAGTLAITGTSYKPSVRGTASLGYRFDKLVSAGFYGNVGSYAGESPENLVSKLSGGKRASWGAGLYLRAYPLARVPTLSTYVDPWVSVGVGYLNDKQTYDSQLATSTGGAVSGAVEAEHHGVAIPMALGLDYRVLPYLSVGPSIEYTLVNAVAGCVGTSAAGYQGTTYCSNTSPGDKAYEAKSYGVLAAGLNVKLTPF